ncbi:MAG TPA: hypothetical protein VF989_20920 [Polyangiaceae bacterium]
MGNEEKDLATERSTVPPIAILGLGGIVLAGGAFYVWLLLTRWGHASTWGAFGDAVGPFVALLNAGALFAALWSIALQRRELELQRAELRETRGEMARQREQFERTAKAQENLAASQLTLAEAQKEANLIARRLEHAQRRSTVATLRVAIGGLTEKVAAHGAASRLKKVWESEKAELEEMLEEQKDEAKP